MINSDKLNGQMLFPACKIQIKSTLAIAHSWWRINFSTMSLKISKVVKNGKIGHLIKLHTYGAPNMDPY